MILSVSQLLPGIELNSWINKSFIYLNNEQIILSDENTDWTYV